jgi:hypothetical protein
LGGYCSATFSVGKKLSGDLDLLTLIYIYISIVKFLVNFSAVAYFGVGESEL